MEALGLYLAVSFVVLVFIVVTMIGYGSSHKEPGIVGIGVTLKTYYQRLKEYEQ